MLTLEKEFRRLYKNETDNVRVAVNSALQHIIGTFCISDENLIFEIKVILNELVLNAFIHGNKSNSKKDFLIILSRDENYLYITVEDEGTGFDTSILQNPKDILFSDKESGRGLLIVKNLCDKLIFNKNGSRITVIKEYRVNC